MKASEGFHLIEILITFAIIAILFALSVPIYSQHLIKERRLEALQMLARLAIAMEKYHIEYNTYRNVTLSLLHVPTVIAKENYRLKIRSVTDTDYVLTAIPLGIQAKKDKDCGTLILHSSGKKGITGLGKMDECW